jgi:uncharacterized protein YdhG (YjbR/CyaY superfamily)
MTKEFTDYIAAQPEGIRPRLNELYAAIKAVLPDAAEKIAYQMPTFWQGRNLIHTWCDVRNIKQELKP